jgi:VWFA-related protein
MWMGGYPMLSKRMRSSLRRGASRLARARVYALIALFAPLCLPIRAQTPEPSSEPAPGLTATAPQVQMNADEVLIDLIVRDKKKRPVLDLALHDLAVADSGKPVELSALHLVTAQSGATVSIAMLFDNMTPESAKVARDMAAKFIAMAPGQCSFAVLGVDRGLRLFQGFTHDRVAVQAATGLAMDNVMRKDLTDAEKQTVSEAQAGGLSSGSSAGAGDRATARMMLFALEESQRIVQDQHAAPALAGLEALAKSQQNLAGRKIVLFFSAGLRANSSTANMTKEVLEAANRAGIGIYTVDTNAVDSKSFDVLTMMYETSAPGPRYSPTPTSMLAPIDPERIGVMGGSLGDAKSATSAERDRLRSEGDALVALANGTGGFSISAGDNPREPFQRLIGDIATYYEATYTPVLKGYDGQFHSIDIQPLREGVSIRSRAGYFALAPEVAGAGSVRPFEAPLLKFLSDSPLPADVFFQQAVVRLGGDSGRTANEIAIEVPVSHLELRRDERTMLYTAHVSILAQIRDKSGVVIERFSEDFSRKGALETIEAARAGVLTLQRPFMAAPGDYVLEAVVLDRLGERAGAERTEFTIAGPGEDPWLSDIAMVRRTEPLGAAPDPSEPMQYAKARVVPNVSRQVATGTRRVSFFFRIHSGANPAVKGGKLDVELQRDGKSVSHSSMDIALGTDSDTVQNLATIESNPLTAGSYRAIFTYAQGDKAAVRDSIFTVDGSEAAGEDSRSDQADDGSTGDADGAGVVAPPGSASSRGSAPPGITEIAEERFSPASASSGFRTPGGKVQSALIASARERALGYVDSLVNFKCIEVTDRFLDPKGTGSWPRHDKIAEIVTFENHEESRTVVEVNGQPANALAYDMKGARLEGEFGGVLGAVFAPASKAEFRWKETDVLDGAAVEVFSYRVDVKNSQFSVKALPELPATVAFHGLVYIDDATRGTLRITMEADEIPAGYPVHASAIAIDYDYIAINNHDYLMPVEGEMRMKVGKLENILHKIEFRDYHRFGSDARIVNFSP